MDVMEKCFYPSGCNTFGCFDSRNLKLVREGKNKKSWSFAVVNFWLFTGLYLGGVDKVCRSRGRSQQYEGAGVLAEPPVREGSEETRQLTVEPVP